MSDPDPPSRRALLRESTDRRRFVRNAGVVAVGGTATMGLLRGDGSRRGPADGHGLSEKGEERLSSALSRAAIAPVENALTDRGYEVAFSRGRSSTVETEQGRLSVAIAPFEGGDGEFAASRIRSEPYLASVSDGTDRVDRVLRGRYEREPGRLHVREFGLDDGALTRTEVGTVPLDVRLDESLSQYVDRGVAEADDDGGSRQVGGERYTGGPGGCSPGLPGDVGCVGPSSYCCDINWACAGQIMAVLGCTAGWFACLAAMGPLIGDFIENGGCHWCECCKGHYSLCE